MFRAPYVPLAFLHAADSSLPQAPRHNVIPINRQPITHNHLEVQRPPAQILYVHSPPYCIAWSVATFFLREVPNPHAHCPTIMCVFCFLLRGKKIAFGQRALPRCIRFVRTFDDRQQHLSARRTIARSGFALSSFLSSIAAPYRHAWISLLYIHHMMQDSSARTSPPNAISQPNHIVVLGTLIQARFSIT
jgi:hypothetical protein